MIAYFDTSALVPLIITEPATNRCRGIWTNASRIVSSRVIYPEARAALAKARRTGRASSSQIADAIDLLDTMIRRIDHIDLTPEIAATAGSFADTHDLRAYDAVHLATANAVASSDLVLVTGDGALAGAAASAGLAVATTGA